MKKIVSGLMLFLLALPALAEDAAVLPPPQVEANPMGLILFALVFVGDDWRFCRLYLGEGARQERR